MTLMRPYRKADREQLNRLALEAFAQYQDYYADWPAIRKIIGNMADLEESAKIIVVEESGTIVGGVALVPPSRCPQEDPDCSRATLRMLVVAPSRRGRGIGKSLTIECIGMAKDLGANMISLHTSPIMAVALSMYLKMGFTKIQDIEPICGVEYSTYALNL